MLEIKLIDNAFNGQAFTNPTWTGESKIWWDRSEATDNDEIVIVTDDRIYEDIPGKVKIAWLFEGEEFKAGNYEYVRANQDKFDYILTWDAKLIALNPEKFIFMPYGGSWIKESEEMIYPKTKLVSIVASGKNFLSGHKMRHEAIARFEGRFDVYGRGYNPIDNLLDAYKDYMYTIAIENMKIDHGFSEKVITPMLCGTIPIYYGPDYVQSLTHTGIITFNTLDELEVILGQITPDTYNTAAPYVQSNFEIAKNYRLMEDTLYDLLIELGLVKCI